MTNTAATVNAYFTDDCSALDDSQLLDAICRIETLGDKMPAEMLPLFVAEADKRGLLDISKRISIEKRIVKSAVSELEAAGFVVMVDYGDDDLEPATDENLQACDEEVLVAFKDGKRAGVVWLIYGNDGYDVIADNSGSLDKHLVETTKLAEQLEENA
jgi:hypothetical protein